MWSLVRLFAFLLLATPAAAQTDPYLASNGTFKIPFALTNTWTAVQTFNVAPVFGVLPSVPLAQFQILQGNGSGIAAPVTFSAAIDAAVGSTRGSILERGASGWQIVAPGTTASPWVSNGTGADPGYQALTGAGIAAGTIANSNLANMTANTVKGSIAGGTPADLNAPFITGGTQGQVLTKNSSTAGDATFRDACLNIEAFGGIGNNSTDNTTPLNNALTATAGIGCIYFPPGKYKFNSAITYSFASALQSIGIYGSGIDVTTLFWPSGNGITFNYNTVPQSVHFSDLTMTTGTAGGSTALTLNSSTVAEVTGQNTIARVSFRGDTPSVGYWNFGVSVVAVGNIIFDSDMWLGITTGGSGISLVGVVGTTTYGFDYIVTSCNFFNTNQGIAFGSYIQGLEVTNSTFSGQLGINVPAAASGTLAQLFVTNSQFNTIGSGIGMSTAVAPYSIIGNLFFVNPNSAAVGATANGGGIINGNIFVPATGTLTGTQGVSLGGVSATGATSIANNSVFSLATGLNISASGVTMQGNSFVSTATPITSGGAGNTIINNPGYNPVGTSARVTMGTSPFTVTAGASPETHYVFAGTGGTINPITKGGQTIAAQGSNIVPITIDLGPYESYITTWATVAATFTRDIH
jgi:hypothetical protein